MTINGVQHLERGMDISIDTEAVSGPTFRVSDYEVKDMGLTTAYAVSLVSAENEAWALLGTTNDAYSTLESPTGNEYTVFWTEIAEA